MSITEHKKKGTFSEWWFRKGRFVLAHIVLVFIAITMLMPFLWMVVASMKPLDAVEDLSPLPAMEQRARFVEMNQMKSKIPGFFELPIQDKFDYYWNLNPKYGLAKQIYEFMHDETWVPDEERDQRDRMWAVFSDLPESQQRHFMQQTAASRFSVWRYFTYHFVKNYDDVWNSKDISFKRYYFNSLLVAGWVTLLQCFTSSLAAYAFARLSWPGRDHVFKLYLATMMIPGVVTMIPNYTLMVKLHLLDSYVGLIVPAAFSAFGTFLLRQFMLTIPPSLDEAATIDGATHWRIYWDVILPLSRSGLIVLSIFTFMGNYGSFFWPLVLIKSEHLRTLPIGMLYFDTAYGNQTNLIMAASVMNILPLVLLFIIMQKHLVRGIQLGAIKG